MSGASVSELAPPIAEHAPARWSTARRLIQHRPALAGAVLIVVVIVAAAVGPLLWRTNPDLQTSSGLTLQGDPLGISAAHPLGTDPLGRDELARVLHGARISLTASLLANALAALLGIVVGGVAGIRRAFTQHLLMRSVDVVLSFPTLLLAMVFVAIARPSIVSVALIIGIGWGAYLSRIVFGIVQSLAGRDMTASAIAAGAGTPRILVRHLLPHALPAVIVYITLGIGVAIQAEAVFGYIGVGIQPPEASWGNMIADAQAYIVTQPRLVLTPAVAIVAATLGFALLGDGLRHVLDPTLAGDGDELGRAR